MLIMSTPYFAVNAWREILARTLSDFRSQDNLTPEWLVNPATKRRLKLDKFYPEIGLAVRFIGLTAKGQGRQSDWEQAENENRDQTREELCRQHGVELTMIDPGEDAVKQMDLLLRKLTRTSQWLVQSDRPVKEKQRLMPLLNEARNRGSDMRGRLSKDAERMIASLAEAWRDRENGMLEAAPVTLPPAPKTGQIRKLLKLEAEQRVRHERFGEGVVIGVTGEGEERKIKILFDGAQERTFQLSLVADKLEILS